MAIYPQRKYKIQVIESKDNGTFSLWFPQRPETMVEKILEVVGFIPRQTYKEYYTKEVDLRDFGLELKACLEAGVYPEKIPYQPRFEVSEKSIEKDHYGLVTVEYIDSSEQDVSLEVLVFETTQIRANSLVWIFAFLELSIHIGRITLRKKTGRDTARKYLKHSNYLVKITEPFGTGLTEVSNGEINGELNGDINGEINGELNGDRNREAHTENQVNTSDSSGELSGEIDEDRNRELNGEFSGDINGELNGDRKGEMSGEADKNIKEDNSSSELVSKPDTNKLQVDKEERENNRPEIFAPITQPYAYNYLKLHELIPNIVQELEEGKTYYKSKVNGIKDLTFELLYKDDEGRYVFSLSQRYEQNNVLVPDPEMKIRLDPILQMVEALSFQDYKSYTRVYEETDQVLAVNKSAKGSLNTYLKVWLKNLIDQGHSFDLSTFNAEEVEESFVEESVDGKLEVIRNDDKITLNEIDGNHENDLGGLLQLSSISIATSDWNDRPNQLEYDLTTWTAANNFFDDIIAARGKKGVYIKYKIFWEEDVRYGDYIDLSSTEIETGKSSESLSERVIKSLVKSIHFKEGRYYHIDLMKGDNEDQEVSVMIHSIDFGLDTNLVLESLMPRIPVESISVNIGEAKLLKKSTFSTGCKYFRASELLRYAKGFLGDNKQIKLSIKWKDGKSFEDELRPLDIDKPMTIDFWKEYFTDKMGIAYLQKYQWKDDQALLFSSEIKGNEPEKIYASFLSSQWQPSDPINEKSMLVSGVKYNVKRFREKIIELTVTKGVDERSRILKGFASQYDKNHALTPLITKPVQNQKVWKIELEKIKDGFENILLGLDFTPNSTFNHYKWLIEKLLIEGETVPGLSKSKLKERNNKDTTANNIDQREEESQEQSNPQLKEMQLILEESQKIEELILEMEKLKTGV